MEKILQGYIKDGKIILYKKLMKKSGKVTVILTDEEEKKDAKKKQTYLLRDKFLIKTKNFKFDRDEIHER